MKAVIIAAGEGSRFYPLTVEKPKPLLKVSGVPLIERVIGSVKKTGITEFVIIIGYLGQHLQQALGDGSRLGVSIEYVHNTDWKKKNGVSVLAAQHLITDNFILLMCDHLFDPTIIQELKVKTIPPGGVMLAVDSVHSDMNSQFVDLEDVTKVQVYNHQIKNIGKEISEYDSFDTGIFLSSPGLFEALEQSKVNGDCSLSDGIRALARQGKAHTFDIGNRFWVDVDTKEFLDRAEAFLKTSGF